MDSNRLCICIDEIPSNFKQLGSSKFFSEKLDEEGFDGCDIGLNQIFIFLANLFDDHAQLALIFRATEEWEVKIKCEKLDFFALKKSLSAIVEKPYDALLAEYIFSRKCAGTKDILLDVEASCIVANKYAKCLCDPMQVLPSGKNGTDIVATIVNEIVNYQDNFSAEYSPIIGRCGNKYTYLNAITFANLLSAVSMAALFIIKNRVAVKQCKNCGRFFIPSSRSDEVYCDRLLSNGKTCKTVGYDEKIKRDDILRVYRKSYKTQNARKQRNSHRPNISANFDRWKLYAKEQLKKCQNGEISTEEMVERISGNTWMDAE